MQWACFHLYHALHMRPSVPWSVNAFISAMQCACLRKYHAVHCFHQYHAVRMLPFLPCSLHTTINTMQYACFLAKCMLTCRAHVSVQYAPSMQCEYFHAVWMHACSVNASMQCVSFHAVWMLILLRESFLKRKNQYDQPPVTFYTDISFIFTKRAILTRRSSVLGLPLL